MSRIKTAGARMRAYRAWAGMKSRCTNPRNPAWKYYGGRGIKVCERWLKSFDVFYADMGHHPGDGFSIDRHPNNDGDYEPWNCRWATQAQQAQNTRSSRPVNRQWIRDARNRLGWTIEELAQASGLSSPTVAGVERGSGDCRRSTILKISNALEDAGAFFDEDAA